MKKKVLVFVLVLAVLALIVWGVVSIFGNKEEENTDVVDEAVTETKVTLPDIDIVTGENTSISMSYIKNKELPIILYFYAEWCENCQQFNPVIEEVEEEYDGKVVIQMVDIDLNSELYKYYEGAKVPTLVFVNSDGTPYAYYDIENDNWVIEEDEELNLIYSKYQGALDKDELVEIIEKLY